MSRPWAIVGSTVATQAAQAGLLIYGFSALALQLEQEFGATRFEVMLATTCLSLASSALGPVAGRWVDKGSARRLMLIGAAMLGLGLALVSVAQAIWQVWLAYALVLPFGNVLLGQLTSATLITRWFAERRGRAMGISTLGTSLGGFIFPVLIATASEAMGWRGALLAIGLITAATMALIVWLGIRDRPEEPKSEQACAALDIDSAGGLTIAQIIAQPAFWIITVAVGVKLATYIGLVNNLAGFAREIGVESIAAAGMVSVLSITSMVGKLGFGTLAERFTPRALFILAIALTIVGFALLLVAYGMMALVVACVLLGLSTGGMLPLWNLIVAEYFGEVSFGRALGLTSLAMVPLTAFASPFAGWVFDRTGHYDGVIWGSMVSLAVSIALLTMLPPANREEKH
ncbi:MFS transporter [Altererythrobacter arenosus]|uniref:MFS transporter n=1 Tax=Altererythrobacter arenosus TaxID=3032592 RepID=A0ABY8FQZ7_9SPHN|nr:MFS transporter [Altererythrobacter sp. CAU 1644]WFL76323.1 MFS transporter [Altererythrobacter sp. CAU 1644]